MKKSLLSLIMVFFTTSLFANQLNTGCGLGTMLLGSDSTSKFKQILITFTNSISTNQSTGITLDVEAFGCTKTENWVKNEKLETFIQGNIDNIIRDVAAGSGSTIDSLAVILNVKDKGKFASKLQENFDSIFPHENVEYAEVSESIYLVSLSLV